MRVPVNSLVRYISPCQRASQNDHENKAQSRSEMESNVRNLSLEAKKLNVSPCKKYEAIAPKGFARHLPNQLVGGSPFYNPHILSPSRPLTLLLSS